MKKIIYLAIIAIIVLSFYPDILADIPGGSYLSGIINTIHSFFAKIQGIFNSLIHQLTDSLSTVMDSFKSQTKTL
ncbi:MAG TPA: hypothetical protein VHE99_10955 [Gammaproteobacteria bacterium]|nr:hypothetical protein [Gammaproteobacteria bacterium]